MSVALATARRIALEAFDEAVAAVQPGRLIPRTVEVTPHRLRVRQLVVERPAGRVVVAALGKAAGGFAAAWLEHAPGWCDELCVLAPHGVVVPTEVAAAGTVRRGRHPTPDAAGVAASHELLACAGGLGADDLLVVLLSGGASALLATPRAGITLPDLETTTAALLAAGAPIAALNTVRRALLAAAGGGLAHAADPARVVTLVLSDVLGNRLADIASGPTVASPTSAADALAVLAQLGVARSVPAAIRKVLANATAADPAPLEHSQVVVLADNGVAVAAAAAALATQGWTTTTLAHPVTGEAHIIGRWLGALAATARPQHRWGLVAGGETTVTVRGGGRGGRNQELALAAALALDGRAGAVLLAAGTDGIDGASANAGAVVDPTTVSRLRAAGIRPADALLANDSATALEAIGDAIVTGPTGTNVGDLVIALIDDPRA